MTQLLWIFAVFDVGALLLLIAELASKRALAPGKPRAIQTPAIVAGLVASYALELAITAYAVFHQAQTPPKAFLPLPLTSAISDNKDAVVASLIALAALQTFLLACLYRARAFGRWVWIGCAALVAMSLVSPIMVTADAYAYVADALLGRAAYAPPSVPFTGQFAPIGLWWSNPFPPTPYGPLWLAAAWLATAAFGSLLGKVIAIRVLGAVAFGAVLLFMRRLGVPDRIVAVTALNPGLLFEYVTSAHNDLFGIALLCAAGLAVRRPAIAAILVVAGGLVKLPFALLGLPLMVRAGSKVARVLALILVPTVSAALTFAVGGAGFYRALLPHAATTPFMTVLSGTVGLVVVAAAIAALFSHRRLRSVVWLAPLASAYTLSSYSVWGLPYALGRRRVAGYLLIGFPLAVTLLEVKFFTIWSLFVVVPFVFAWQIVATTGSRASEKRAASF